MNQIQYRSTEGMNIFHGTKQQGTNSMCFIKLQTSVNTLRPRRNEQHFADDIFKRIFFNENVWISIKISLKFVPKGPINNNNIPALVQIMAWRRSSYYLNQWWLVYPRIYASLGLNELSGVTVAAQLPAV